jgi:hypothetical protein
MLKDVFLPESQPSRLRKLQMLLQGTLEGQSVSNLTH